MHVQELTAAAQQHKDDEMKSHLRSPTLSEIFFLFTGGKRRTDGSTLRAHRLFGFLSHLSHPFPTSSLCTQQPHQNRTTAPQTAVQQPRASVSEPRNFVIRPRSWGCCRKYIAEPLLCTHPRISPSRIPSPPSIPITIRHIPRLFGLHSSPLDCHSLL